MAGKRKKQSGGGDAKSIVRKVRFFVADNGHDDAGRPVPFDAAAVLAALKQRAKNPPDLYLDEEGGDALRANVVDADVSRSHLEVAEIVRTEKGRLDREGVFQPPPWKEGDGLGHSTFITFFPKTALGVPVGIVQSKGGPGSRAVQRYLRERAPGPCTPVFGLNPVIAKDAVRKLRSMKTLRTVKIRASLHVMEEVKKRDPNMYRALDAAMKAGRPHIIELLLKAGGVRDEESLDKELIPGLARLAELLAARRDFRLVVSGFDAEKGEVESIDLLAHYVVERQEIMTLDNDSGELQPTAAYSAILQAFGHVRHEFEAGPA